MSSLEPAYLLHFIDLASLPTPLGGHSPLGAPPAKHLGNTLCPAWWHLRSDAEPHHSPAPPWEAPVDWKERFRFPLHLNIYSTNTD